MSNATFVEAMIVGVLLIALGAWMHFLRTPLADRETRLLMRRLAVGYLVAALGFAVMLVLLWKRLTSLHTVPDGVDPTSLGALDIGLAAFAVAESSRTVLVVRRRRA
jgi:hypothetical protein